MKTLLTIFVLFFSSSVLAEELFLNCVEIDAVGFDGEDNYEKFYNYTQENFEIKINTKIYSVVAEGISFKSNVCDYAPANSTRGAFLSCSDLGYSFNINLSTFKYTRSRGYGFSIPGKDDILIGYGLCYSK